MTTRIERLSKFTPQARRSTPFEQGKLAYHQSQSLKGLPYGPGWRQDDYIRGYHMASSGVVFTDAQEAA